MWAKLTPDSRIPFFQNSMFNELWSVPNPSEDKLLVQAGLRQDRFLHLWRHKNKNKYVVIANKLERFFFKNDILKWSNLPICNHYFVQSETWIS